MDTDFHSELSVSLWYDILCVLCFLLCMFLLYITVLLPVVVIKDDDDEYSVADVADPARPRAEIQGRV